MYEIRYISVYSHKRLPVSRPARERVRITIAVVRKLSFCLKLNNLLLHDYEVEWNRSFGATRRLRYNAKELAVRLTDEEINRIMRVLVGIKSDEFSLNGFVLRFLRRDPLLLIGLSRLVRYLSCF
jgi:hypothetical protein